MPLFWENVDQGYSGIDLTTLITNDSVVIWKPEFTFPDASQVNILSEVRHSLSSFIIAFVIFNTSFTVVEYVLC